MLKKCQTRILYTAKLTFKKEKLNEISNKQKLRGFIDKRLVMNTKGNSLSEDKGDQKGKGSKRGEGRRGKGRRVYSLIYLSSGTISNCWNSQNIRALYKVSLGHDIT